MTPAQQLRAWEKTQTMEPRYWWALVRSPRSLPVLFQFKHDAEQNRDPDEYLVRVRVESKRVAASLQAGVPQSTTEGK